MFSAWPEQITAAKRLSVPIISPSGIGVGYLTLSVIEEGDILDPSVDLPKGHVDISYMQKKSLQNKCSKSSDFHPNLIRFEATLSDMGYKLNDKVAYVRRIAFSFPVQSHIDKKRFGQ